MNFLGHLYFSNNNHELMLHNLYGDFIKGKDISFYPPQIQEGILLHRAIDSFIDTHPKVLELLKILYPHLPKVSAIAIDLFFDHLLAKNWNNFHQKDLNLYLKEFYSSISLTKFDYKVEFSVFIEKLIKHNWISYYPQFYGLEKSCQGVSNRLSFPNSLDRAPHVFKAFENEITAVFNVYMQDAIVKFTMK